MKLIGNAGAAAIMAIAVPMAALAAVTGREAKIVAEASTISISMADNFRSAAGIMTDAAKKDFDAFCDATVMDGVQCFMPDFSKVKYAMVGGHDDNGFVVGFYNPFYDAFFLMMVEDADKVAKISGFRAVTSARLRGADPCAAYPAASGSAAPVDYLPGVLAETRLAGETFKKLFNGDFRTAFAAVGQSEGAELERLLEIAKYRVAHALKIANDKNVLRDASLAEALLKKTSLRGSDFLSKDASTKKTLETVDGLPEDFRKAFKVIAYFPDGEFSNVVFFNKKIPTALVQAHVGEGQNTWFRLFDANVAGISKVK